MKAIILTAGYATRLYPLTLNKAKALLQIAGKPIISHITDAVVKINEVDEIIVVSNAKFFQSFADWKNEQQLRVPITVLNDGSDSPDNMRGAIGDMDFAVDAMGIDEDCVVIAGDNFNAFDLLDYYSFYKKIGCDCVCVKEIKNRDELKSLGVAKLGENGKVIGMVEKPQNPESPYGVFATYFYKRDTMRLIKQYLDEGNNRDAPGNFPQWLYKRADLYAYIINGECYDIGTVQAYNEVMALYGN